jgi:hypothetical protein
MTEKGSLLTVLEQKLKRHLIKTVLTDNSGHHGVQTASEAKHMVHGFSTTRKRN